MKVFSVCFFLLPVCHLLAQIPNAGFENWQLNNECRRPVGWNTVYSEIDSSGSYCPVQRSEEHFPADQGQFSMRIANDTALWNSGIPPVSWLGWGIVFSSRLNDKPLFPVQGRPGSFIGYYRFQPQNGDTLNLRAFLYSNGQEITNAHFQSSQVADNWTFFRAYFSDTNYAAVDSARITMSSANEPKDGSKGPLGNSVLWIDNISFDFLAGASPLLNRNKEIKLELIPDASGLKLIRESANSNRKGLVRIFDAKGLLLFSGEWTAGSEVYSIGAFRHSSGPVFLHYDDGERSTARLFPLFR
jgi:hypothetical protein